MQKELIESIFYAHWLWSVQSIEKIEIGFSNDVYCINGEYILKVCSDENNEENFKKEIFFYNFFKGKIPIPQVRISDTSKELCPSLFILYPRIPWENLYNIWHLLPDKKRKKIIWELCEILRYISDSYEACLWHLHSGAFHWHDHILEKIRISLHTISERHLLSWKLTSDISRFIEENHAFLEEETLWLVYWDVHFDNILVQDDTVVGILDFERVEIASLDYILNVVKRMMEYPKKYMSEKNEKFARKKDYARLFDWYKEFFPELFEFDHLNERLKLYWLEHDLQTYIDYYPNASSVKNMIIKNITPSQ